MTDPTTDDESGTETVVVDHPDVETIGAGGGPRDDPKIPCHECGTEERFMTIKRDPEWTLEYVDAPYWVAYCPDCSGGDSGAE